MPQINLPDALRYFFSPFVVGLYYCIFDPDTAKQLLKDFGAIPTIAGLVAGITFYYVYRYCIYNDLIMTLYDACRKENFRIFIKRRYNITGNPISSTKIANRIVRELSDFENYSKLMEKRGRPMRVGGIHMLYQAFFCSLVFAILSWIRGEQKLIVIFSGLALVQLYTALRMDTDYENEELILGKTMLRELDQAAAPVGVKPPEP